MFYVISPPDATDWHLDHDVFSQDLRSAWPSVRIHPPEPESPTRAVIWSIDAEDPQAPARWLEGSLDRSGQAFYLRGDLGLAADFAQWIRRNVDPRQSLVFCDEAFTHTIDLVDDMSAENIVRVFTS